jgi:hypothetical protein
MTQSLKEKNRKVLLCNFLREYWHGKSLEVACSFLPSECPLVNHIMTSY